MEAAGLVPTMWFGPLERRKPPIDIISPVEAPPSAAAAPEPSVRRLRNVGVAAALSNVSSQISRFNPIGKLMRPPPPTQTAAAAADEIRFTDLQSAACGGGSLNDDDTRFFDTCDDDAGGGLHIQNIDRMSALYSPSSSNCAAIMPSIQVTSSIGAASNIGGAASRSPTTSDVRRRHRKISRSSENLTTTDDDDLHRHPMENVLVPFAMLSQAVLRIRLWIRMRIVMQNY
jgi:hypothetical protein